MQAALMGCALESYIIDNDMIGAILRTLDMPLEFNREHTLDAIRDVVHGDCHFLGHADTLSRMQSDYLYPKLADRLNIEDWQDQGALAMDERARLILKDIMTPITAGQFDLQIDEAVDADIRSRLDIRLNR